MPAFAGSRSRPGYSQWWLLMKRRPKQTAGTPKTTELAHATRSEPGRAEFDLLFKANPQPMWIYERGSLRFLAVNDAAIARYGYSEKDFLSMTLADIRPQDDLSRLTTATSGERENGYRVSTGWRHRTSDGELVHVHVHSHEIAYAGHEAVMVTAVDVTELSRAIEELETKQAYFSQLFENSPEGIVLLDQEGRILEANEGFQKMFGFTEEELLGKTPLSLIVPKSEETTSLSSFAATVDRNAPARMSTIRRRKNGELVNVDVLAYPVLVKGKQRGIFAIYQDVTEKQRALSEMEHQIRHDALTALPNRLHLTESLEHLLASGHGKKSVLLYIDLDQFKLINDACGHAAGDQVLNAVASIITKTVRDSDLVARFSADEFAVLLPACTERNAIRKANEIIEAISAYRWTSGEQSFDFGASIGIVEISSSDDTSDRILAAGAAACNAAKESGRNRVRVYQPDDEAIVSRRQEINWLSKLRSALKEDRFVLFFQEIHGLNDETPAIQHKEILIRYKDDDGKLVPPVAFIPSAERYNLMPAIDRWVLETTCRYLAKSDRETKQIVSVNISGTTLSDEHFPEFVKETLLEFDIKPEWLCFEITETAAITNLASARKLIDRVKALGCSIALDDFGSGMSSFSYLRTLSVDYLKIDGTFVREMDKNKIDYAMTEAIDHVGKILGLKTIAEFVENKDIYDKLKSIGVDYAQGYGLHVPEQWSEH